MKRKPVTSERRRCCDCRSWYLPAASTAKTQKTCSRECRLRRRAKQEKVRRAADLENAREDERERQRRHRERMREAKGRQARGPDPPLSRAGLSVQVIEAIEQIVEDVGQAQRLSQAGLCRRVRRIAMKILGETDRGAESFGT
jgi:hypothetical protein